MSVTSPPVEGARRARVLVVDGDWSLRAVLEDALTDHGLDLLLAADGAAALDLL